MPGMREGRGFDSNAFGFDVAGSLALPIQLHHAQFRAEDKVSCLLCVRVSFSCQPCLHSFLHRLVCRKKSTQQSGSLTLQ